MDPTPTSDPVLWKPSRTDGNWITMLGLAIAVAAIGVGFAVAFQSLAEVVVVLDPTGLAVTIGLTVVIAFVHEGIHGLGFLAYGGRPRFGAGVSKAIGPYISCNAPGLRLSMSRYVTIRLAPTVVLNGVLVAGLLSSFGGLFILPLAAHLAACVEDWFTVARALKASEGSLIEDIKDGLIIHATGHTVT